MKRLALALVVVGCASSQQNVADCKEPAAAAPAPAATKKTLYDRLGGKPAIEAVIDNFLGKVAADARINHFFAGGNITALRGALVDQVCQASGGPCTYQGRDMRSVHAGMRIDDAAFDALVEDLVAALDELKVPAAEKGELLAVLGPMKKDIVER